MQMKKSGKCFWLSLVCFILAGLMVYLDKNTDLNGQTLETIGVSSMVLCTLVFIPAGCVFRLKEKRQAFKALPKEEREKLEAKALENAKAFREDRTIVSAAIVNTTSKGKQKASATSSIVRGAVGGALFGPVGMVAGAVTPKKTTVTKDMTVTFSVLYESGRRDVETVKVGSKRYNELAKYIA